MYPSDRFSEAAKQTLNLTQAEAERSHSSYIGVEHLLVALVSQSETVAHAVFERLGVRAEDVRATIDAVLGHSPPMTLPTTIPTSRVKSVIELSFKEAQRSGSRSVRTHHLLVGILLEGQNIGAHVLQDWGANLSAVRGALSELDEETRSLEG